MGNPNLVSDFQNLELVFFHQLWYQLMKYRFSIKFDQKQAGTTDSNPLINRRKRELNFVKR